MSSCTETWFVGTNVELRYILCCKMKTRLQRSVCLFVRIRSTREWFGSLFSSSWWLWTSFCSSRHSSWFRPWSAPAATHDFGHGGGCCVHQSLPQRLFFNVQDNWFLFLEELKYDYALIVESKRCEVKRLWISFFCRDGLACCPATVPVKNYFDQWSRLAERKSKYASACQEGLGMSHRRKHGYGLMQSRVGHSDVKAASLPVPTLHESYWGVWRSFFPCRAMLARQADVAEGSNSDPCKSTSGCAMFACFFILQFKMEVKLCIGCIIPVRFPFCYKISLRRQDNIGSFSNNVHAFEIWEKKLTTATFKPIFDGCLWM